MKFTISFLNVNWFHIQSILQTLKSNHIIDLHLDIMDGHLTDQISFGATVTKQLANQPFRLSGHFMTKLPSKTTFEKYLSPYLHLNSIIWQYEALSQFEIKQFLEWKTKHISSKIGFGITIPTDWKVLIPYLKQLDYVLIMLVNLGKGGQKMQTIAIKKLIAFQTYCQIHHPHIKIIADGGINLNTINQLPRNLDYAVLGSYCWKQPNLQHQLTAIQQTQVKMLK